MKTILIWATVIVGSALLFLNVGPAEWTWPVKDWLGKPLSRQERVEKMHRLLDDSNAFLITAEADLAADEQKVTSVTSTLGQRRAFLKRDEKRLEVATSLLQQHASEDVRRDVGMLQSRCKTWARNVSTLEHAQKQFEARIQKKVELVDELRNRVHLNALEVDLQSMLASVDITKDSIDELERVLGRALGLGDLASVKVLADHEVQLGNESRFARYDLTDVPETSPPASPSASISEPPLTAADR